MSAPARLGCPFCDKTFEDPDEQALHVDSHDRRAIDSTDRIVQAVERIASSLRGIELFLFEMVREAQKRAEKPN